MTLLEKLEKYKNNAVPMHMPGHKRHKGVRYLKRLAADIDITEIDGFDDLHHPSGIIKESQERAAKIWGAAKSHFLVGGSTAGIISAIYSHTHRGDTVLLSRNCHKSVYHAIEICGLTPRYIYPEKDENGIFLSISPEDIENNIEGISLVIITSPTYEGIVSDIGKISEITHKYGALLLVDEAHGAHFGFSSEFPKSAIKLGADIVIQSLHKTLPSLTQTAIAHLSERANDDDFSRALNIFETSSPSYLLMSSIDSCIDYADTHRHLFKKWSLCLDRFKKKTSSLKNLRILFDEENEIGRIYNFDKSKIVICTSKTNITGFDLMNTLRKHKIELEMASYGYAIAMTGIFDSKKSLMSLARALRKFDKTLSSSSKSPIEIPIPEFHNLPCTAVSGDHEIVFSGEAEGCVSAEYIWAYPPGIPMIVPGEIFTEKIITSLQKLKISGANIISCDESLITFKVVKKLY